MMNGPSAQALRVGGMGGSLRYKSGTTVVIRVAGGAPLPAEWKRKTKLQEIFGDFGQVLRIDVPDGQGVAFIEYEDKLDAEDAAKEVTGRKVGGQTVSVQIAQAIEAKGHSSFMFTGRTLDISERINELARNYRLDEAATVRLASVFSERARLGCDINRDITELGEHLAVSNKPSALVSMKLADLRAGRPIGPCKYTARERAALAAAGASTFGEMREGRDARESRGSRRDDGRERERDRASREECPRGDRAGREERPRERSRRRSPRRSRERGNSSRREGTERKTRGDGQDCGSRDEHRGPRDARDGERISKESPGRSGQDEDRAGARSRSRRRQVRLPGEKDSKSLRGSSGSGGRQERSCSRRS
mmetsp:Transcript_33324/g.89206  ORF Transcript_33324/g.89206 Transcript_33324/m.89206 type:complete len:365 (-) Transcript_33324:183-1277(-)